jgi:uncharacterized protein YdeI (YjbR/CyaY-like superfamily)
MEQLFFATRAELRAWFTEHHGTATELWIGFYKKGSGVLSVTLSDAQDEALCVGWIDSVSKGIDAASYSIRFTPRKQRSNWSAVNIARVANLTAQGRMLPAGLAAFERRAKEPNAVYSYEQDANATLDADREHEFRANTPAWDFFQAQPPSYRKAAIWWVTSAKREDTRRKRLADLIECSQQGRTVPPLTRRVEPGQ